MYEKSCERGVILCALGILVLETDVIYDDVEYTVHRTQDTGSKHGMEYSYGLIMAQFLKFGVRDDFGVLRMISWPFAFKLGSTP